MRKHIEWLGKPMKYGTRRLVAGGVEALPARVADMFIKRKLARPARLPAEIPPPPAELLAKFDHDGNGAPGGCEAPAQSPDLKALRAEYTEKLGKRPFPGWGADVLRDKITAHD